MRVTINRAELLNAAKRAAAIAPSSSLIKEMTCTLLETDSSSGKLTVTSTNMEMSLEQKIRCVSQDEDALAVNARLLAAMLEKLSGEMVELRREEAFEETVTPGAGNRSLAVYCVSGSASLPRFGLEVQAGQTLLCLEGQNEPFTIKGEAGVLMVACVREA